jgi:heat shock protein 1/8
MSNKIIGIDLGTTYSCLACWDDALGKVVVIPSPSGRTMASWVSFLSTGKLVGDAAKAQASSNSANTVYDVKRIIGRSFNDPVVHDEMKQMPYRIEEDGGNPKIVVEWRNQTKKLSAEEVSAMILTELKVAAEAHLGEAVRDAVITVPAHFNNQQRQATKDAGRIAGLNVKRIINEPTAAALAYGLHGQKEDGAAEEEKDLKSNVVIFDLGGGTFDVTVLTMNGGVFEVKATGGDTHLGGEDFDQAVVAYLLGVIGEVHGAKTLAEVKKSPRALSRLRRAVEVAKRALSSSQTADIEIDSFVEGLDFTHTLGRDKFEEINSVLFKKCIDTVKSVLVDASVDIVDVTDVVLVGGSTRVPYLQTQLHELFDKRIDLCKSVHPDEAVAIGAAVQGHILATGGTGGGQELSTESTTDLLLLDVTPLSLGIELEGKQMSTLIKRNTAIPCKKTRTYTTVDDFQTSIDVVVYEGERSHVDANNKLGSFVISGVQRARAGEPQVDVTFALDANGILHVTARDQVTQVVAQSKIKAEKGRLTQDDIDRMIADAEQYRAQDEELAQKASYRNSLEEALYTAQSKPTKTTEEETELCELMDWLELDSETASLDEMRKRGRILEDKYGLLVSA